MKRNVIPLQLILMLWVIFAQGCATLFDKHQTEILVKTNPPETKVKIRIVTPRRPTFIREIPGIIQTENLHRRSRIEIVDSCYQSKKNRFRRKFSWTSMLNILSFGLGFIVDGINSRTAQFIPVQTIPVSKKQACDPNDSVPVIADTTEQDASPDVIEIPKTISIASEPTGNEIKLLIEHPTNPAFIVTLPAIVDRESIDRRSTYRYIDPCYGSHIRNFRRANARKYGKNVMESKQQIPLYQKEKCTPGMLKIDISDPQRVSETTPEFDPFSEAQGLISLLGGIQFKVLSGIATVESSVKIENENTTIANGKSQYRGYQISFQRPELKRGFSYSFFPNSMQQTIKIADFRESVESIESKDSLNIPVDVTDFETGLPVDPDDPNTYNIGLTSWGIMAEGRYGYYGYFKNFNLGYFGDISLGAAVAEQIAMEVEIGDNTVKETEWYFAPSASLSVTVGLLAPKINSAFRLSLNKTYYPSLRLPEDVEFRGPVLYNEEKDVLERKRIFINEVALDITNIQFAYTYVF